MQTPLQQNNTKIADDMRRGVAYHQAGDLESARGIYNDVLDTDPLNPDALHLLGVAAYQTKDLDAARTLITRAIRLKPQSPVYHKNLGNTYRALDQLELAASHYLTAIELQPGYADAYIGLGNIRQLQKLFSRAVDIYRKALEHHPDNPDIYNNLGAAYFELGNWKEAITCYQTAIELKPGQKEVYNNLGNALQATRKYDEAIECYNFALQHCEAHPKIWINLGNVYRKIGKTHEAIEHYNRALTLNPGYAEAYNNIANILKEQGQYDRALQLYRKAVDLEPDNSDLHFNLGLLHQLQDNPSDALFCYRKAVQLEPLFAEAHLNTGKINHDQLAFDDALASYQEAIRLNPDYSEAYFNRSLTFLITGRLKEGFQDYEWRFKCPEWQSVYPHLPDAPRWDGSSFAGRRLFVYSEQGLGDTLQYIRYLPMVKSLGGEVIFETLPELMELLKDFPGIDRLVGMNMEGANAEEYELQIPLMSLAAVFQTTLDNIPAVPYLQADPDKVQFWSQKVGGDGLNVGLVWAGKPDHKNDRRRSCPLEQLRPLLDLADIRLWGLQKGEAAKEINLLPESLKFSNLDDDLNDFGDTAAAVQCLDLVISVDTAVAHLAGAMGKPVWLLLPYTPDWRWLTERPDTPWYPGMRLFRQPEPDNWSAVVQSVDQALKALIPRKINDPSRHEADSLIAPQADSVENGCIVAEPTAVGQAVDRRMTTTLHLGLKSGSNYGWGVCSDYLIRELSSLLPVHVLNENDGSDRNPKLPGKLFQALTSVNFFPMFEKASAGQNYGYTFFENELTRHSFLNAKKFDLIIGGSTWCRDRLREGGIENCDILIQGVDPELFYPIKQKTPLENFVIFSGGKFELRKGQDIVLRALKIMQDRYDDIILVNCWYNLWPESIALMNHSPHIKLPGREFDGWTAFMNAVYQANGLDPDRIKTFELVLNHQLRELYRHTNLGIFPNRCEGGTNLVLMEYMACGKPVIASNTSGHRDIVTSDNALLLNDLKNLHLTDSNRNLIARWQDPSLDELVAKLEYAYHHRKELERIGQKAGEDLKQFTWKHSAGELLRIIGMKDIA